MSVGWSMPGNKKDVWHFAILSLEAGTLIFSTHRLCWGDSADNLPYPLFPANMREVAMLAKFRITNFRGYSDFTFDTLKRITILGGKNNTGKTSALEAFAIFCQRMNPNITIYVNASRGVPVTIDNPSNVWGPLFRNHDLDKDISFEGSVNNVTEVMQISLNKNFPITSPLLGQQTITQTPQGKTTSLDISYKVENEKEQISHLILGPVGVSLQIDYAHINSPPCVLLSSRMPIDSNELANRFGQLELQGGTSDLVELLKTIEPRLDSLTTIATGNTSCVYGDIGLGRKIPIPQMGDGMNRLLHIALVLATTAGGLVLIDEFENGIHFSVMSAMWEAISKMALHYDCQIIATTHSYECLQSAHRGMPDNMKDDFVYIRLDRGDDQLTGNVFDYSLLSSSLSYEMEVR